MATSYINQVINQLKAQQKTDVEDMGKLKASMMEMDATIKERAKLIKLIEMGMDDKFKEMSISDVMATK